YLFFFSSRRRHTRFSRDWSSDVCSSDLAALGLQGVTAIDADPGASTTGIGRVGDLAEPVTLGELARTVAALLPETATGVRVAGRSEERRVGKEWRSRWPPEQYKKTRAEY